MFHSFTDCANAFNGRTHAMHGEHQFSAFSTSFQKFNERVTMAFDYSLYSISFRSYITGLTVKASNYIT